MTELLPLVTLHQPWASLCFTNSKKHETRGRPYPKRFTGKRIVIHAAVRAPDRVLPIALEQICFRHWGENWREELPRGLILGTAELFYCMPTNELLPDPEDRICGDWGSGRFGWRLWHKIPLAEPLSHRGKQGWSYIDPRLIGLEHA